MRFSAETYVGIGVIPSLQFQSRLQVTSFREVLFRTRMQRDV